MPELPDLELYRHALRQRLLGVRLAGVRLKSPFVLRSVDPPPSALVGQAVTDIRRLGKRLIFAFEGELFAVIHLMISGRLSWKGANASIGGRTALLAFDFPEATLLLTEANSKKRASLHIVRGEHALADFDRGGVEVGEVDLAGFRAALVRDNHTLKRALTDPRLLAGIGNAYSDEILHRARLSPFRQTSQLTEAEWPILFEACRDVLVEWTARLKAEAGEKFPEKVTAFHPAMAVHGKYGQPCPACGTPVQRIVYANNEANYCATCQTGGRLLADRVLSMLLKKDWPRTLEELEERKNRLSSV